MQALALSDDEEDYTEEELEEREEAAQASQRLYGNYETEAAQRLSRDMRTKFESSTKWSSEFPDKLLITQTQKTQQPDGTWKTVSKKHASIPRANAPTTPPPMPSRPPPAGPFRVPFGGGAKFGDKVELPHSSFSKDDLGRVRTSPRRRRYGEKSPDYHKRIAKLRRPVPVRTYTADQYAARVDSRFEKDERVDPSRIRTGGPSSRSPTSPSRAGRASRKRMAPKEGAGVRPRRSPRKSK